MPQRQRMKLSQRIGYWGGKGRNMRYYIYKLAGQETLTQKFRKQDARTERVMAKQCQRKPKSRQLHLTAMLGRVPRNVILHPATKTVTYTGFDAANRRRQRRRHRKSVLQWVHRGLAEKEKLRQERAKEAVARRKKKKKKRRVTLGSEEW